MQRKEQLWYVLKKDSELKKRAEAIFGPNLIRNAFMLDLVYDDGTSEEKRNKQFRQAKNELMDMSSRIALEQGDDVLHLDGDCIAHMAIEFINGNIVAFHVADNGEISKVKNFLVV